MGKTKNSKENDSDTSINTPTKANNGKTLKVLTDKSLICYSLSYHYEDTEYLIEEGVEEEYSFSEMEIYSKRTTQDIFAFKNRFYNRKPLYNSFRVTMKDVKRLNKSEEGISVSLYKKGIPKAIAQKTVQIEKQEIHIDWTNKIEELEPGGYFLWLRGASSMLDLSIRWKIGEDIKVDFEILEDGEELTHPEITQITIEENKASTQPLIDFKHRTHEFNIHLAQALEDGNVISFCCYNEDLYQMTENIDDASSVSKSELNISLSPQEIWMTGTYDVILLHNQTPFARFSFVINNDQIELGEIVPVERYDKYFMIGRYLSINKEEWDKLSHMPSAAALRKAIADNIDSICYNLIYLPFCLDNIYENMNYLIESTNDNESNNMIELFCYLISNARSFETFDCREKVETFILEKKDTDLTLSLDDSIDLIFLKNANSLLQNGGEHYMSKIISILHSRKGNFVIACNEGESEQFFDAYPALRTFIPESHRVSMINYSTSAIAFEINNIANNNGLIISEPGYSKLADVLIEANKKGALVGWNKERIMNYVYDTLISNYRKRKLSEKSNEEDTISGFIEAADISIDTFTDKKGGFEDAMADLNEMIGLGKVKQNLEAAMNTLHMFQIRKNMGLSSTCDMSYHMLFTGNPGTGKTTVAKLIGKIFKSLGLLSKGEVIVADRGRMVGQWIGETERKMRELLVLAQGNVLFIDEAYALSNTSGSDRRDYGYRVIECLMPIMASDNPNMLIIMAGYPKEMDSMMELNSGLKGRFPYKFNFEDYTAEELIMIGTNLLKKNDYQLSPEAEQRFCAIVNEVVKAKDRNFSNARWVEQFIRNGIFPAMAQRIVCQHQLMDREFYRTVELTDVETAYLNEKDKDNILPKRAPIGYSR